MAELGLSIAGLVLAWKAVLDFGYVINQVITDDARRRDLLVIRLEVSQHDLRDWGEYWGITSETGRFQNFTISRKALIVRIIQRLSEDREKAITRLRDRYGLFIDARDGGVGDGSTQIGSKAKSSTLKIKDKIQGASKKAMEKSLWLVHDRTVLEGLVEDTFIAHDMLKRLSCDSYTAPVVHIASGLQELSVPEIGDEQAATREAPALTAIAAGLSPEQTVLPQVQAGADVSVIRDLIPQATIKIRPNSQMDVIQGYLDLAIYYEGDDRIAEAIGGWWNESRISIFAIEGPDAADDPTMRYACLLFYYLVDCQKLVYTFDDTAMISAVQQFNAMLQAFVEGLICFCKNEPLSDQLSLYDSGDLMDPTANASEEVTSRLIDTLGRLLKHVVTQNNNTQRVLIVIEGMELLSSTGNDRDSQALNSHVLSFIYMLQDFSNTAAAAEVGQVGEVKLGLKVLLGYKGYATGIYQSLGEYDVCNLTDKALQTSSMLQSLAITLDA
ncbi:hypothetical protein CC79DRAFT_421290 [Sarocladium strictum]